ncbi:alpha/beta hydrolase [Pseudonocardia sp. H11422]|uniref:alpha/beta hydrolase family protein n=1 Tax=Pseudonocardia sp. H11422 TaxID=2835866 RepID=UPI0027E37A8C|nr:alpha/beta hydrolase [Pseudonocardia sp. H11422]
MSRRRLVSLGSAAGGLPAAAACAVGPRARSGGPAPVRLTYGDHPSQFGELMLPPGGGPVRGVVVIVHGGFWRRTYGLELGRPLATDLAGTGLAVWNIEYRRVGGGGGWPATFDDVAAAVDLLAGEGQQATAGLDLDRVVALGHSAGGHLGAWLAVRPGLPAGAPGAGPRVRLRGVVSQAGVLDLVDAAERGVGAGAVEDLLGGSPSAVPDRYALGSPAARVPMGVPVVCVHGTEDRNVPLRQSERFVAAARVAGDLAELVELPGTDHFAVIKPDTGAWTACRDVVERLLD